MFFSFKKRKESERYGKKLSGVKDFYTCDTEHQVMLPVVRGHISQRWRQYSFVVAVFFREF